MTSNSFPPLTRRDFLKRAALAGAAPFILPSVIRAAHTPPNSRITLGCIGLGIQGRGLLNGCLQRDEVHVVAVCDVDTTRRNSARQMVEDHYGNASGKGTYKGCAAFGDFRELLSRKDIDAVVIATPDHWHALTSIAAAKAGKASIAKNRSATRCAKAGPWSKPPDGTNGFFRWAACSARWPNFAPLAN